VATRFGAAAVRAVEEEKFGHMVALDPPTVKYVHLEDALSRMKQVPLDCDSVLSARDIGICLGDE
jgi:6-phosphofructokinase